MSSKHTTLLQTAESFCTAFATGAPLPDLLSYFTSNSAPEIHEHGPTSIPNLTSTDSSSRIEIPFLGRTFSGRASDATRSANGPIEDYFAALFASIRPHQITFHPASETNYFVDEVKNRVTVRGFAKLEWVKTGVVWEEEFVYLIDFEEEHSAFKVKKYQLWADTAGMMAAVLGVGEKSQ